MTTSKKDSFSYDYKPKDKNNEKETKWVPPKRQKLTEEEKELKRQEMMANASWREKERDQNYKKYKEEEKRELKKGEVFDETFFQ